MKPPLLLLGFLLMVLTIIAATKAHLAGAQLTADNKTTTTDASGTGVLDKVKTGAVPLKIAAPGKPIKEVICQVKRGKNNSVSVEV